MSKELIQIQAYFDRVGTHKDGALGIGLSTQELNSETKIKLMDNVGKFGWFLFKESDSPITEDEIPKYEPEQFDQIKSPATRMRAVLYRIFEQQGKTNDFDAFYREKMEAMINKLKEKLL